MEPIPRTYTRTVASRQFEGVKGGERHVVVLEVGEPIQVVESTGDVNWRCPVRVLVDDKEVRIQSACGVDSYQAMSLAMYLLSMIEVHAATRTFDNLLYLDQEICLEDLRKALGKGLPPDHLGVPPKHE